MSSAEACSYAPAATVRHAVVDGLRVILDLRSGTYRVLDEAASALWPVLTGDAGLIASFEYLRQQFAIDEEGLRAELAAFGAKCVREGLLVQGAPQAECLSALSHTSIHPNSTRPSLWRAWLCLMATRRALLRDGFPGTYRRYGELPAGHVGRPMDSALQAFTRAENFFVARRAPDDCLVRSLALFRFLRLTNFAVEHVIGVCRYPFVAHAWVEYEGAAILDQRIHELTPIARICNQ